MPKSRGAVLPHGSHLPWVQVREHHVWGLSHPSGLSSAATHGQQTERWGETALRVCCLRKSKWSRERDVPKATSVWVSSVFAVLRAAGRGAHGLSPVLHRAPPSDLPGASAGAGTSTSVRKMKAGLSQACLCGQLNLASSSGGGRSSINLISCGPYRPPQTQVPQDMCFRYWCVPSSAAMWEGHTPTDVSAQVTTRLLCCCVDTAPVMGRAADLLQESPVQVPLHFKGQTLGSEGSVELPAPAPPDQTVQRGVTVPGFSGSYTSAHPLVGEKRPRESASPRWERRRENHSRFGCVQLNLRALVWTLQGFDWNLIPFHIFLCMFCFFVCFPLHSVF